MRLHNNKHSNWIAADPRLPSTGLRQLTLSLASLRIFLFMPFLACVLGCRTPDKPTDTSGPTSGSIVLAGDLDQVITAISNAFRGGAYHGKELVLSPYDYVRRDQHVVGIPVTNRWSLFQGALPLTLLTTGNEMVAYHQDFEIKAQPVDPHTTEVIVRSGSSWVTEPRYELSMHLNRTLATRPVAPLASETTNLLQRIERQLVQIRAGRMAPLPPTADTRPGYYNQFWTKMTLDDRHNSQNWHRMVQAWKVLQETQPARGVGSNPEPAQQGIDGLWTGKTTNGMFRTLLSLKFSTNGCGAFYGGGGNMGVPGTFTYALSNGQVRYVPNDTPRLTGTLRYDPAADVVIYQESAEVAKAYGESGEPILLHRDADEMRRDALGLMIGATNYLDVMTRLGHFLNSLTNHPEWFQTNSAGQTSSEQHGPANRDQPVGSGTNRTSAAPASTR